MFKETTTTFGHWLLTQHMNISYNLNVPSLSGWARKMQLPEILLNEHGTNWNDPWKVYSTFGQLEEILAFIFLLIIPRFCEIIYLQISTAKYSWVTEKTLNIKQSFLETLRKNPYNTQFKKTDRCYKFQATNDLNKESNILLHQHFMSEISETYQRYIYFNVVCWNLQGCLCPLSVRWQFWSL